MDIKEKFEMGIQDDEKRRKLLSLFSTFQSSVESVFFYVSIERICALTELISSSSPLFLFQGSSSILVVMVILLNIGVAILFIHFFI